MNYDPEFDQRVLDDTPEHRVVELDARSVRVGQLVATCARVPELSARERQILDLLFDGLTGKQIAEHLKLSPKTVSTYLTNAENKFDVPTPIALVRAAIKRGLLIP